jgi:hypothetical protein
MEKPPLNTNFRIKNEKQDCKIGPVREWVLMGGGKVNGGGEGG